jgi:hypothetical protein
MQQEKPIQPDPIKRGVLLPPGTKPLEETTVEDDSFSLEDLLKIFFGIDT